MLSLSPRFDLFVFKFPKDFLPEEVEEKYAKILAENKAIITNPIDYLNESIQGITFPGLSDLLVEQDQHSQHPTSLGALKHHINVETGRKNNTYSPGSILSQITGEFTVTLRQNQGLYNYFMVYESIFYKVLKQYAKEENKDDVFYIDILDEKGNIVSRLKLFQPRIDGIDGLEFNYSKVERSVNTFDLKFKFNNIDFEIMKK